LNLSPEWFYLFEVIAEPVRFVIRLRYNNELPAITMDRARHLVEESERVHARLREAMRILDGVALKTWSVCHLVNRQTDLMFSLLAGLEHIRRVIPEPKKTSDFERDRRLLVEQAKDFDPRPALMVLREAVTAERGIEFSRPQTNTIPAVADPRLSSSQKEQLCDAINEATIALLSVFSNGCSDERIRAAAPHVIDDRLTVNEKLEHIDALIPLPATASAEQLGRLFGVTKQAVLGTEWWDQNRKGEKKSAIARRRAIHKERAANYERPNKLQDDESR
jgi:hypothetical protein